MSKFGPILKDGLILFAVSTGFVFVTNLAFSSLERHKPVDDPIVTAILQNDASTVEKLASSGPSATNRGDELGRTALMRAAFANYSDAALTAKADNARSPMVACLAQHGAAVDARDHDGWTPLVWAGWSGMPGVAGKLLDAGASPNLADNKGNTALIVAAEMGRAKVVELLLGRGAVKTVANQAHLTALDAAKAGLKRNPGSCGAYERIIAALGA